MKNIYMSLLERSSTFMFLEVCFVGFFFFNWIKKPNKPTNQNYFRTTKDIPNHFLKSQIFQNMTKIFTNYLEVLHNKSSY